MPLAFRQGDNDLDSCLNLNMRLNNQPGWGSNHGPSVDRETFSHYVITDLSYKLVKRQSVPAK